MTEVLAEIARADKSFGPAFSEGVQSGKAVLSRATEFAPLTVRRRRETFDRPVTKPPSEFEHAWTCGTPGYPDGRRQRDRPGDSHPPHRRGLSRRDFRSQSSGCRGNCAA